MEPTATSLSDAQAFLDGAPCGLLQTDSAGLILQVNQLFCNWVGHDRSNLVGKRKLQELFTMGARIFHQTHWLPLLQLQGSISEVKLEIQHSDGHTVPMVLNAISRNVAGRSVHDVATFVARDRDAYERELVKSRRELEDLNAEANRLKALAEQMLAIVSHDLRTPLSVMGMSALLLSKTPLSPQQGQIVERVKRANSRASRLIDDLLDFSQARLSNGLAVTLTRGDANAAVAEIVSELKAAHPQRTIVHHAVGEGLFNFDADRLAQVVGNLISNAIAYGHEQSAITVRSGVEPATFTVSVHNHGNAIPPDAQVNLFDALVRGTDRGQANHSMGLGLYIADQIVKAHGGSLSVTSTKELGTQFEAVIPMADKYAR